MLVEAHGEAGQHPGASLLYSGWILASYDLSPVNVWAYPKYSFVDEKV